MSTAKCSSSGCENAASTLQCPTCSKMNLPLAYFCSQECFRKAWPTHKLVHNQNSDPLSVFANSSSSSSTVDERFAGYGFTGDLRPGKVSARRTVPPEIPRPDYADDPEGIPRTERELKGNTSIKVHNPEEINKLRISCQLAREVLDYASTLVIPGRTTDEIDEKCHNYIISKGAYPSPLNYRKFPKSICTSINETICHGIPDSRELKEGDIVNVDVTVYYLGYHGDVNETYFVGGYDKCSEVAKKLVQVTYEALDQSIKACHPRLLYREVGPIISKHVHSNGFSVVKAYCGHGVGQLFHTAPNIPHYSKNKAVGVMQPGHVFTIEPMINEGAWKEKLWPDDWTAATVDGKLSAQFEHTIVVTTTGCEVLTARTAASYPYPWLANQQQQQKKPIQNSVSNGSEDLTGGSADGGAKKKKKNKRKKKASAAVEQEQQQSPQQPQQQTQ